MAVIKILQLSDLHLDSSKTKDPQIILNALWKDLDNFKGIDFIVFTGDLVKAGDDKDSFGKAFQIFIEPLLEKTGVPKDNFFMVPGNHEVQLNAVNNYLEKGLEKELIDLKSINSFIDNEIENGFSNIERLDHYNDFKANVIGSGHAVTSNKLFSTHVVKKDSTKIGIACLNSAWRAAGKGGGHDNGKMLIGERQVYECLQGIGDCDIKIALHHHPLDWLTEEDKNYTEEILFREFDFIFCGHLHRANPKMVKSLEDKIVVIQGGALYEGRPHYNGYSVLSIDPQNNDGILYLRTYFDGRKKFDKAIDRCDNGTMPIILKGDSKGINILPLEVTKGISTIEIEKKSEREADQVKEQFRWLLEIKNPSSLPKELESLGNDECDSVAEKFVRHSDINNPLALESLARKIRKRSCVVAFVGPQLCGKSWLARNICRFIAPNVPDMHPEVIVSNDIQRIMYNLRIKSKFKDDYGNDEDILSVVRYRIFAAWARRLTENALRCGLKYEEFLELRKDNHNDDLINFTEDLDLALSKLLKEKEITRSSKASEDFTIFENCIDKLLPNNLKYAPYVLAVEIEDLHDYEKTMLPKMDSGEKFISHFWDTLKSSVDDLEYNKEKNIDRTVGIIVTTRQQEFIEEEEEENTETDLILNMGGFPKIDCQRYAKEIGLEDIFGTESLKKVTDKAFQLSRGYIWFYVRFLRSVTFLYLNAKAHEIKVSVDQIIDAVSALPVFWYWKDPCDKKKFRNIAFRYLTKQRQYPKHIPDCSTFLYNIIKASENNARLINFYKRCLEYPQIEMSDSDIKRLLLPLLRLGLLRRDDLNQTFLPWNEIISRHFRPDHLLNFINSESRRLNL